MKKTEGIPVILEVRDLCKSFMDNVANEDVSIEILEGEVHCLLGENGAGKSTLAKCIYGMYRFDSGKIIVKGEESEISTPKDAINLKIGMVHQHFVLIPSMTSLENIIVGTQSSRRLLDLNEAKIKVQEICGNYQIEIDLNARIDSLAIGQQQWVEILKALYVGVDILILDEPTASLTPQETNKLFAILRKMTSEGISVILITHKLREVMEIADRVTVLRNGRLIATKHIAEVTKEELAQLMVGREVLFQINKTEAHAGSSVCSLKKVNTVRDDGFRTLKDVSLEIYKSEIFGIAGVGGNGQDELFDVLVGIRKITSGEIIMAGRRMNDLSPTDRMKLGLASIPPDRITQGLLMSFSLKDNLIFGFQHSQRFKSGLFLDQNNIDDFALKSIQEFDMATSGPNQVINELSGGNLQKLILARELSHKITFIIASCPTRGLDVGATEFVHNRLMNLRDEGVGILLISEDLDEIFNLSDRAGVLFKGEIMGVFQPREVTREKVGLMMAGVREKVVG